MVYRQMIRNQTKHIQHQLKQFNSNQQTQQTAVDELPSDDDDDFIMNDPQTQSHELSQNKIISINSSDKYFIFYFFDS